MNAVDPSGSPAGCAPPKLAELRARSRWLGDHARNVTSQTGEDGLLSKVFDVIGVTDRCCVDIGAWDGIHGSNTRQLVLQGWKSVQVECDPERFRKLSRLYAANGRVTCIRRLVQHDGPDSLERLLDETGVGDAFDLLCIDVDGNDYHLWASLERHRPRTVVIEYNFSIPDEVAFVQPADPHVAQGSSLRALVELGRRKGYELVFPTGLNALFVQRQLFPLFGIADNAIEVMHAPRLEARTHVFFGYDGTVFVRGAGRLPWQDVPFPEKRIQVLPRFLRTARGYNRWQRFWILFIRARLSGDLMRPHKWLTGFRVLFGRRRITNIPGS